MFCNTAFLFTRVTIILFTLIIFRSSFPILFSHHFLLQFQPKSCLLSAAINKQNALLPMLNRLTVLLFCVLCCFSLSASRAQSRDTLVILNEVMFNPPAVLGANAEYIEIFNVSFTDSVQINISWRFGDASIGRITIQFPTGAIWLRPRQYASLNDCRAQRI
jgi:hypothetical protein